MTSLIKKFAVGSIVILGFMIVCALFYGILKLLFIWQPLFWIIGFILLALLIGNAILSEKSEDELGW